MLCPAENNIVLTPHSWSDDDIKESLDNLLWGYPKLVDAALKANTKARDIEKNRAENEERASDAEVTPGAPQVSAFQRESTSLDRPVVSSTPATQAAEDNIQVEETEHQNTGSRPSHAEVGSHDAEEHAEKIDHSHPEIECSSVMSLNPSSLAEDTSSNSLRINSSDDSPVEELPSLQERGD